MQEKQYINSKLFVLQQAVLTMCEYCAAILFIIYKQRPFLGFSKQNNYCVNFALEYTTIQAAVNQQ